MMNLLDGLNPAQQQAVTAPAGPVLVLAGPGSGKTRVLTHRIAYLVHDLGLPPEAMMAVTFTNKAAGEMRERVEKLLGGSLRGLTIGTFHAISARLLRREADHLQVNRNFVIYDEDDQQALVKQVLRDLNLDEKQYRPSSLLGAISRAKNELIPPEAYRGSSYFGEVVRRAYVRYQQLLVDNNAMDFDDLLVNIVRLFDDQPEVLARYQRFYEYVLVDEFQDTNTAQYTFLQQLTVPRRNLYCVADEDQSIYRWRGADYRNIHRFRQDFPEAPVIVLEQNYRSTQNILDAAKGVILRNPNRIHKALFTDRGTGEKLMIREAFNEVDEAQYVVDLIKGLVRQRRYRYSDFAVMYRTNAQSRPIEDMMVAERVPYKLVGGTRFYARREIKDALAYLRLIANPADRVSFSKVVNVPPRGIGPRTVEQLLGWAEMKGITVFEAIQSATDLGLSAKPRKALVDFGEKLAGWIELRDSSTVLQTLDRVLNGTGYGDWLRDGTEQGEERWQNVLELRTVAAEAQDLPLQAFLEEITLLSDVDSLDNSADAVTILTLHAAKGLEFPIVFITGLEDGIVPHSRSLDDPEALAEERRLFYVGMTRAKDRLYLVHTFRRTLYGESNPGVPSRFLNDIPTELIAGQPEKSRRGDRKTEGSDLSARVQAAVNRGTRWERSTSENRGKPDSQTGGLPAGSAGVPTTRFRYGQRVRHPLFGEGVVLSSKVVRDDEEVIVAFDDGRVKQLATSMARLEVVK